VVQLPQLYQLFFNDLGGIGLPTTIAFWKGWRGSRASEQAALELADSARRSAYRRWRRDHESGHLSHPTTTAPNWPRPKETLEFQIARQRQDVLINRSSARTSNADPL
jgi:hypothetical protein